MFGKASSSQAPSASKRLFGSSIFVACQSVFHIRTSFPRDLGNGMSFSQYSIPFTSSSKCSSLFTKLTVTAFTKECNSLTSFTGIKVSYFLHYFAARHTELQSCSSTKYTKYTFGPSATRIRKTPVTCVQNHLIGPNKLRLDLSSCRWLEQLQNGLFFPK